MTRSALKLFAVGVVAFAASVGCAAGGGTPASSESSAPTSSDVSAGVPKVAHPLDSTKFQKDPCSVVTPAQIKSLGIAAKGKPDPSNALGPFCTWSDTSTTPSRLGFGVTFVTSNQQGLASIYQQKDSLAYFQPVDVDGYPGVFNSGADTRSSGSCNLSVGLSDQLELNITTDVGGSDQSNPCPTAQKVAGLMITTMKGAQ